MGPFFGFVQVELPGTVALDDGRYLDRLPGDTRVLAVELEGALPPARRKRRRPRKAGLDREPAFVPLTVATVVFAEPELDEPAAERWLQSVSVDPETGDLLDQALATINRGVDTAHAVTGRAIGDPISAPDLVAARIGYGEGEQVYAGRFTEALEIDPGGGGDASRRARIERIVPLARIAAILAGREPTYACEVMIPRLRNDLEAGRLMPAALTVGEAVRATVTELDFALEDPDHDADLDLLEELLPGLLAIPERLLGAGSSPLDETVWQELRAEIGSAVEIAERVIRRYHIKTQ